MGDLIQTWGDFVTGLAFLAVILLFIKWELIHRFRAHEEVEMRQYAGVRMDSESAVSAARETARIVRELRGDFETHREKLTEIAIEIKMHDRRLGAIEERYMRAALTAPVVTKRDTP